MIARCSQSSTIIAKRFKGLRPGLQSRHAIFKDKTRCFVFTNTFVMKIISLIIQLVEDDGEGGEAASRDSVFLVVVELTLVVM